MPLNERNQSSLRDTYQYSSQFYECNGPNDLYSSDLQFLQSFS